MTDSRTATRLTTPTLTAILLAGLLAIGGHQVTLNGQDAGADVDEQLRYAQNVSLAFQEVTRSIGPSVVNITTEAEVQRRRRSMSPFGRSPFDDFFERFFEGMPPHMQPQRQQPRQQQELPPQIRRGQGSGVIVSEDGYVVTNYHVIAQADTIRVQLTNGDEYEATIVGTDPETDLAVLQVESNGSLVAAEFGDSDALNAGEWVLAVGNPFGFEHTVTAGIVSATGRQLGIIRDRQGYVGFEDFIQTDAAINPGNSGGPLVNLQGQVVGINSAIASQTGGYMGLGFAIPSSMVRPVVESIIEEGSVTRGYLGIFMNELTDDLAESLGYEGEEGVVVADLAPDGPASQADVQVGDVITGVNGRQVRDMAQVRDAVAMLSPGTEITLEIFRDGEQITSEVTLQARPTVDERVDGQQQDELGVTVREVTEDMARQLGLRRAVGVVIEDIEPAGIAARAGLRPNDVILNVGDREIESLEDYREAVAEMDLARGVRLRVARGGMVRFYVLRRG